jgi:23S rRNA (cytosine1962-C5)-methyltransferase
MPDDLTKIPRITISRRGAERLRDGHVWVYRSDVVEAEGAGPGALVVVQEVSDKNVRPTHSKAAQPKAARARVLGKALYSSSSEIALRMISKKPVESIEQLVRERIRAAIAYRERFVQDTNAYRVIFSEGDLLPGLIVDRYNDILSLQVLTQAMDSEEMRRIFVSELREALQPRVVVERVDARVRKLEQLQEKESGVLSTIGSPSNDPESGTFSSDSAIDGIPYASREGPALHNHATANQIITEFQMNGVRFVYHALGGQKTGAFLDQRENYAAAAQYARGEALDVFCYQGGFALHLARNCEKVTGVDSSRPALEAAEQNATLNGRDIEWIEANAFDLLRDYSDAGQKYDSIVLDPPAFAKSKRDLPTALRGYKELNLRALKMLRPGGILVTCSCSYHVSNAELLETVSSAAADSHRIIRVLENRGQAKDHPNVLGIPETSYLKCLILLVS